MGCNVERKAKLERARDYEHALGGLLRELQDLPSSHLFGPTEGGEERTKAIGAVNEKTETTKIEAKRLRCKKREKDRERPTRCIVEGSRSCVMM